MTVWHESDPGLWKYEIRYVGQTLQGKHKIFFRESWRTASSMLFEAYIGCSIVNDIRFVACAPWNGYCQTPSFRPRTSSWLYFHLG